MGRLVYFDGETAICRVKTDRTPDEKVFKLLFDIGNEAPDMERHIVPLLDAWGIPDWVFYSPPTSSQLASANLGDQSCPESLGKRVFIRHSERSEESPALRAGEILRP